MVALHVDAPSRMLTFRKMQKNWFRKNAPLKKVENAAGEKVGCTRPCGGKPKNDCSTRG
jgi:hypothetical protein